MFWRGLFSRHEVAFYKMKNQQQKIEKVIWVKLKCGEDLLKRISGLCKENNVRAGYISVIGALEKAKFSYYNQQEKQYHEISKEEPVAIISCLGSVSIKDGEPFIHAHIAVSDSKGAVFGGHLNEGCLVFTGECFIFKFDGEIIRDEGV